MAGDRARVSFDPTRKWRGLVAQQGRVTVEADWNEAATIDLERDRLQALDVVGPAGTPDHGYSVTAFPAGAAAPATPGDLTIGPGTLYLGGERLHFDAAVTYSTQPDWLDHSTDPLWVKPAANGNELVYLLASEQEVSAVEDPALADVALGGPDTMQRQRILQHVVRQPSQAGSCGDAWSAFVSSLAGDGLQFDAASMRIESATTLQVSFTDTPGATGPCQPVATGGYLGAENQMIRVMVINADEPTIVWGFDDASFLYRVASATTDTNSQNTTITLASAPVDSYHYPASGQVVELLRDAVQLTDDDYIASAAGFIAQLAANYDPTQMQLVISGTPPPGQSATGQPPTYQPPPDYLSAATQQLYLRVWQSTVIAPAGQATELGTTGVMVTLTPGPGGFHAGDFWRFALRPIQPAIVYPARYLDAPQPPDGPRTWACPLAVLTWESGSATATACVPPFSDLVQLTGAKAGCCTVDVGPSDVGDGATLQTLLSSYAGQGPMTVCLDPGTYTLSEPLVLGPGLNGITLQACSEGVVLQAPSEPGPEFTLGLIVIQGASPVTIRGLELSVPLVGFPASNETFPGLPVQNQELLGAFCKELNVAIGISVTDSAGLTVADCTVSFPDLGQQASTFGAGIYATGVMDGVAVTGCTFQYAQPPETVPFYDLAAGNPTFLPYQLTFGYLQVAIFAQQSDSSPASTAADAGTAADAAAIAADATSQLLHDAAIERCLFQGVTVPVFAVTQLGTLRIDQNTIRNSYGGCWLYSVSDQALVTMVDEIAIGNSEIFQYLAAIGAAALGDRIFPMATTIGQLLPATPPPPGQAAVARRISPPTAGQLAMARQTFTAFYAQARGPGGSGAPSPAAGAASAAASSGAGPEAGPAGAAAETGPAEATPEAGPAEADVAGLPPVFGTVFGSAGNEPSQPVIPVADTGTSVSLRVDLCDCQIDAVIAESYSGAALLLADLTSSAAASALVHGSRLRCRFPAGETVLGFWLAEAAVTGNIVANEVAVPAQSNAAIPDSYSLALVATATPLGRPALAVAGNVFIDPILPRDQEVMNLLNTIIDYSVVPTVTAITPATGHATATEGVTITITGTGFTGATGVTFGSAGPAASFTVSSDTEISATSQTSGSGTVDVTVTTLAGTSATSAADQFTFD